MKRTTYAGLINEDYLGQTVTLQGWVQKRRDLGSLIFIDLRDREGIVQLVFSQEFSADALAVADQLRGEYVIEVQGTVVNRNADAVNDRMKTGKVEVEIHDAKILNKAKTPPFYIQDDINVSDELRLKYRYLDLRRPEMQRGLKIRNGITQAVHSYFDANGFYDIETPFLTKSTPEGARDYLVPSRVYQGHFYALPQSPQLFKQLLMGAGFDRYYQIARCFRDEDLRGDRQPEFTQIDMETSFLTAEEIQSYTEGLIKQVMKDVKGVDIKTPFTRMTWQEAMDRFGSEKPDVRFGMELKDMGAAVSNAGFKVFDNALANGGLVKAIAVPGGADQYSRKQIDAYTEYVKRFGAKGLAWMKVTDDGFSGPVAKFFKNDGDFEAITSAAAAKPGDLLLFAADSFKVVSDTLGYLRTAIAKELDLIDQDQYAYLWVVDWPLFEYDEGIERWVPAHHPFTMPRHADLDKLESDPGNVKAIAYDMVLNGVEIGGGSLRIYQADVQEKVFKAIGLSIEEARSKFGFMLDAFQYGAPPHAGCAFGLDRLVMLMAKRQSIRDVIAFPKTQSASDIMSQAPSEVEPKQLKELHIKPDVEEEQEQSLV